MLIMHKCWLCKLPGVKFNNKLTFEKHTKDIGKNTNTNNQALARVFFYEFKQKRNPSEHFLISQFNYHLLILMCQPIYKQGNK